MLNLMILMMWLLEYDFFLTPKNMFWENQELSCGVVMVSLYNYTIFATEG